MMKPTEHAGPGLNAAAELKRIITSSALALLLLSLAVFLDGPVSVLAWLLLAVTFLCMAYVVLASRQLLIHFRSQDHKADPND